ncbi:ubiquinol-cytochrome c reductase core subunit 1 [Borealophlyctis nickersoniae]|nr:ubiquinol-cytochrome c reductase core subunit 1 [Borealophlyctis nickersoniae]
MKHHPDRFSDQKDKDKAKERFQKLSEAYAVLRDEMLATRVSARPLLRGTRSVHLSTTAVLDNSYSALRLIRKGEQVVVAPQAVKSVSKASNGVQIATYDERGPASSLAIVVKAGSRFESPDGPGVAQFLKNTVLRAPPGDNLTRFIHSAELRGNTIYTSVDREHLIVAAEFLRDDLVDIVPALVEQITNRAMQSYEFLDARGLVVAEATASLADPTTRAFEALHETAFRSGLGNSLFSAASSAKALKRQHIYDFTDNNFTPDRIAIVGTGVAHEDLTELVEKAFAGKQLPAGGAAQSTASKYFGGEVRIEAGAKSQALYSVAFPSPAFTSSDYAAAAVLANILGGSRTKWGTVGGATGLLSSAVTGSASVAPFNVSYSDAGLIGFVIRGSNEEVKAAAPKAFATLKGAASKISEETVAAGRKSVIVDADAQREKQIREVGRHVLANGNFPTAKEFADAVKQVTLSDVQKLAKSFGSAKPTVVAYGYLRQLPFADQL